MSATEQAPVYLDYAATTPLDPHVLEAMLPWMDRYAGFGNPASLQHGHGRRAAAAVEQARAQVAGLLQADPAGVVFTGGATEAINLAVLGAVRFAMARGRGRHVISARTEHAAVLAACAQLEREGARVTLLAPDRGGRIDPGQVREALCDDTVLVSLMQVNNETGVCSDMAALGTLLQGHQALLHVDASQGAGKLPVSIRDWSVDLLSLSAHKLYGPKGVGALWVRPRPRLRLEPLVHGGGQERGYRAGTLAVHQIVGMGEACELAAAELDGESRRLSALRERLRQGLAACGPVRFNGAPPLAPHILNASFGCVHGEALMEELGGGFALSAGSACSAAEGRPSHVLRAMGVPDALARSSVRFSLGRWSDEGQVDRVVAAVGDAMARLLPLSPLWHRLQAGEPLETVYGA